MPTTLEKKRQLLALLQQKKAMQQRPALDTSFEAMRTMPLTPAPAVSTGVDTGMPLQPQRPEFQQAERPSLGPIEAAKSVGTGLAMGALGFDEYDPQKYVTSQWGLGTPGGLFRGAMGGLGTQLAPAAAPYQDEPSHKVGKFLGMVAPYGVAAKALGVGAKLPQAGRLATVGRTAAQGAGVGALGGGYYQGQQAIQGREFDPTTIGLEAGIFGAADVALRGLGGVMARLLKQGRKQEAKALLETAKGVKDAKGLREDARRVYPARDVPEGRAVKGRPDLERQAPREAGRPEAQVKQPWEPQIATAKAAPEFVAPPPVKPPKPVVKPPVEEKVVRLNKAETAQLRSDYGLDALPAPKRQGILKTFSEAKEQGMDQRALQVADEVISTKRATTRHEHHGMALKVTELSNEYDAAIRQSSTLATKGEKMASKVESQRAESILDQIDKLTRASDLGGTEASRALSFRKVGVNRESMTMAAVTQRMQSAKGSKLTAQESTKVQEAVKRYSVAEGKVRELETKYAAEVANREKLIAERVTATQVKKARITSRAKNARQLIMIERADIKKQLQAIGFRVNDITGVTAEGSYLIGRLAVNYIKEGAVTLDAVARKVMADIPNITKNDVYAALNAKSPRAQKKARREVDRQIRQIKTQARLLTDIEKVEKGIFPATVKKVPQPTEIRSLQKQLRDLRSEAYRSNIESAKLERALNSINELQDQLTNQYRKVRKRQPLESAELAGVRTKLKDIRNDMRTTDQLADLKEQLRTGNFKVKAPAPARVLPPALERTKVELSMARKRIRAMIEESAPITARRVGVEAVNTARTLKATADMSATLRQGLALVARRPIEGIKAFDKSFGATFSRTKAEQIDTAIRSADHHYIREKSGLFLPDIGSAKINAREEMFMAQWIEKVPGVGAVVKASNRHMVTFLNLMRTSAFDQFLMKYPNATPRELKAWANWVNIASGRGDLGRASAIANELSLGIFAPRFAASRIETPFMAFKNWKHPRVRKEIAKDYAALAGLGGTALGLAHLAGFEVGLDPRSPDFGKIRVGDTRIDIWGGFQQPARLITRIGLGATDKAGLTGKQLTEREKDIDPIELVSRFAAFKLAPSITVPTELYRGRSIVGEPMTPTETAIRSVTPMVYDDIFDAYRRDGLGVATASGVFNFLGVGTNTYEDSETQTRKKIRRMFNEGNGAAAFQLRLEWNMRHPDNKIVKISGTPL